MSEEILKLIKDKEVQFVDLRFNDLRGKMQHVTFDVSMIDKEIFTEGMRIKQMKEVRKSKVVRGTRHGIYINRTYFGVYMLLHILGAKVKTKSVYLKQSAE